MSDYTQTPSYYNNVEYFNKYLGETSYYTGLQQNINKLVKLTNAKSILELGSALGTTSTMLAQAFPNAHITGLDVRADIVEKAQRYNFNNTNLEFLQGDMTYYVKHKELLKYDFIFCLYSFHHIVDPLDKKIQFLRNCFTNMNYGAYLCVGETFLPEEAATLSNDKSIMQLWEERSREGRASTFWTALEGVTPEAIQLAKEVARVSYDEEFEAGKLVYKRQDEYLIKASWLAENAKKAGFTEIINMPMNSIGEHILLFRK